MVRGVLLFGATSILVMMGGTALSEEAADTPSPKELVQEFCDTMKGLQDFTFDVEVYEDQVQADGAKVQVSTMHNVAIHRPDMLRAESSGIFSDRILWKNREKVTILGRDSNFYAQVPFTGTNDELLTKLIDDYDMTLPLADLVVSNPCDGFSQQDPVGTYVGISDVQGHSCHQLFFRGTDVDWQMWLDDGKVRSLRKLIITYKMEESQPQFTAVFGDIKQEVLPAARFDPEIPADAKLIEFTKANEPEPAEETEQEVSGS